MPNQCIIITKLWRSCQHGTKLWTSFGMFSIWYPYLPWHDQQRTAQCLVGSGTWGKGLVGPSSDMNPVRLVHLAIILLGSCAYELVYISHVMEIWQADNRRKCLAKVTTHAREDTDSPTFTTTQNMMHMYKRNRFCETDSIVMRNDENKALCMERLLASCCFLLLCTFTACHCLYSKCLELLGQATWAYLGQPCPRGALWLNDPQSL